MLSRWQLPQKAVIGGKEYAIRGDFRNVLQVIAYLGDTRFPEYFRWRMALALFYEGELLRKDHQQAMEYLGWFIRGGAEEEPRQEQALLDWEQDADLIVADVNAVSGQEIRACEFLHWWTFLSWFHAIGDGQLATVVRIRGKLRRGQKLEPWEKEYYLRNKSRVDMKRRYTPEELAQKEKLKKLLEGGSNGER